MPSAMRVASDFAILPGMNSAQTLTRIIHLSEQMLIQAEKAEWDRVGELQVQRQTLIDSCFPLDDPSMSVDEAGERIKYILQLDNQVMALAKGRRRELGEALGKINQGRQAAKAYRDTSRG